jgi:hypothetical protein
LQFRLQKALKFASPPEGDDAEFEMSSAGDLADFLLSRRLNLSATPRDYTPGSPPTRHRERSEEPS